MYERISQLIIYTHPHTHPHYSTIHIYGIQMVFELCQSHYGSDLDWPQAKLSSNALPSPLSPAQERTVLDRKPGLRPCCCCGTWYVFSWAVKPSDATHFTGAMGIRKYMKNTWSAPAQHTVPLGFRDPRFPDPSSWPMQQV